MRHCRHAVQSAIVQVIQALIDTRHQTSDTADIHYRLVEDSHQTYISVIGQFRQQSAIDRQLLIDIRYQTLNISR